MLRHLGYAGTTHSIDAYTGRFCRPEEATPVRIGALIRDNLRDLARVLHFNAEHGISFYRISSRLIPYASHPGNAVAWWDEFAGELDRLGVFACRHGLRLEMHPGHHCLLNAPSPETVALSILELGWHVRLYDAMRVDASHKLIVRIGGTFGDKAGAFDRFVSVINGLPDSWRSRLAIENDEARFGPADVLEASDRTGLPVTLACFPQGPEPSLRVTESRTVGRCFATWKPQDGPAIVHLGRPMMARAGAVAKSEWIEPGDLETIQALSPALTPFDCLLEAEQGDRALFELRERLATREHRARLDRHVAITSSVP